MRALQQRCRFSSSQAARACLVSERTYRRWLATGQPNPTAVRLLAILAGYVPWDGWAGWEVHGGLLFPPGYRRHGVTPGDFFSLVFLRQSVGAYRERVEELEDEIRKLKAAQSKPRSSRRCRSGSPGRPSAQVSNTGT